MHELNDPNKPPDDGREVMVYSYGFAMPVPAVWNPELKQFVALGRFPVHSVKGWQEIGQADCRE